MSAVLHIDTDAEYCRKISQLLKKENFFSKPCKTVNEAVGLLETEECFCIIMDVRTKDLPWYEALAAFRNISHAVPIILTAEENSKKTELMVRAEGVTYYHIKSFNDEDIIYAVKEIFTARQKEVEHKMNTTPRKILTIDDDPDFQEAVRLILEKAGYKVVQAFNKEDGKKMVESESPDLILLDIMMESPSAGFHFLYEVIGTKDDRKSKIPVLSISSISQKTGFKFSPSADGDFFPADDFLTKPVDPETLIKHVEALLEKKRD
jgi:DNA-binding response OmpR family regulator